MAIRSNQDLDPSTGTSLISKNFWALDFMPTFEVIRFLCCRADSHQIANSESRFFRVNFEIKTLYEFALEMDDTKYAHSFFAFYKILVHQADAINIIFYLPMMDRKRVKSSSHTRKLRISPVGKQLQLNQHDFGKKKTSTFHTIKSMKITFNEQMSDILNEEIEKNKQQQLYDRLLGIRYHDILFLELEECPELQDGSHISPWKVTYYKKDATQSYTPSKCPRNSNRFLFDQKSNSLNAKTLCLNKMPSKIQKLFSRKESQKKEQKGEHIDDIKRIINQYFVTSNQFERKNTFRDTCQFYFHQNNLSKYECNLNQNSCCSNPYFETRPLKNPNFYFQKIDYVSENRIKQPKFSTDFKDINFQDEYITTVNKPSNFYKQHAKIINKKCRDQGISKFKNSQTFEV